MYEHTDLPTDIHICMHATHFIYWKLDDPASPPLFNPLVVPVSSSLVSSSLFNPLVDHLKDCIIEFINIILCIAMLYLEISWVFGWEVTGYVRTYRLTYRYTNCMQINVQTYMTYMMQMYLTNWQVFIWCGEHLYASLYVRA